MKKVLIKTNNLELESEALKKLLEEKFEGRILVLNLSRENRHLEIALGIESMIIYNSYDYIKGICDLDKATFEINDEVSILPSTIKDDKVSLLLDKFEEDLEELEDPYDYIVFICDEPSSVIYPENGAEIELYDINNKEELTLIQRILAFFGKKYD